MNNTLTDRDAPIATRVLWALVSAVATLLLLAAVSGRPPASAAPPPPPPPGSPYVSTQSKLYTGATLYTNGTNAFASHLAPRSHVTAAVLVVQIDNWTEAEGTVSVAIYKGAALASATLVDVVEATTTVEDGKPGTFTYLATRMDADGQLYFYNPRFDESGTLRFSATFAEDGMN